MDHTLQIHTALRRCFERLKDSNELSCCLTVNPLAKMNLNGVKKVDMASLCLAAGSWIAGPQDCVISAW